MILTQDWGIILIIFIGVIIVVLVLLKLMEKTLYKKIIIKRSSRDDYYRGKIQTINVKDPSKALSDIHTISKEFFKEAYEIKKKIELSQLKNYFSQIDNKEAAEFSLIISQVLYSGKEPTWREIKMLAELLAKIIGTTHIMTKEEKEEQEKLNDKKTFFQKLKDIHIFGIGKKKLDNEQNNSNQKQVTR